jgi:pantothenate kinase
MDGFHFSRAELDRFPDPAVAHERRGAAYTFDVVKLIAALEKLREPVKSRSEDPDVDILIRMPSFDHAVKVIPSDVDAAL